MERPPLFNIKWIFGLFQINNVRMGPSPRRLVSFFFSCTIRLEKEFNVVSWPADVVSSQWNVIGNRLSRPMIIENR